MNVLGISALYHDSAAALVCNGHIIAAAQEERFTRVKHDQRLPVHAIKYCLEEAGLHIKDIDLVVFYDNPLYTLDRYMNNIFIAGDDCEEIIERSFDSMFSDRLWVHKKLEQVLGTD